MTETISEYIETNTGTTIQEIRIVIYERDSVTAQVCQNDQLLQLNVFLTIVHPEENC